ncbi:nucleotidyltransferase family protein [Patescibacteria group bacterium]|nr:nucleotidyltransferase family protein [Patescibacteria group bacterium]MBU1703206.1 nucleotidyltransferase family protein [Patescibacteria group bacterium]MBU1954367.1 nucleotidyltransferase family protein [Patescibacteria group bacterium]
MPPKNIADLKKIVVPFAKNHNVNYIAVFGSFARGKAKKQSDIDLLVSFSKPISLLDLISMELKLGEKMKKKVDLVTKKALHPKIAKYIKKDLKILYEK